MFQIGRCTRIGDRALYQNFDIACAPQAMEANYFLPAKAVLPLSDFTARSQSSSSDPSAPLKSDLGKMGIGFLLHAIVAGRSGRLRGAGRTPRKLTVADRRRREGLCYRFSHRLPEHDLFRALHLQRLTANHASESERRTRRARSTLDCGPAVGRSSLSTTGNP